MSEPLSFRLNESDPDQAQALALITAWREQGVSLPEIITRAVLALAENQRQVDHDQALALAGELRAALDEARRLAETIQRAPNGTPATADDPQVEPAAQDIELHEVFLAAVARNVKRSKRSE